MKVFALGGYGKIGTQAIKLLSQCDLITEIAIAGRNLERAEKLAAQIGVKAVAVHADGTDEKELASLLTGYDVIMNAASANSVIPAIGAAIGTGTAYCDVASFGDTVQQVLQFDSRAKAGGIIGIVANGMCPGFSSLMATHVSRQLEIVQQLQLGLADFIDFQGGREVTPLDWHGDPDESLIILREFKPFILAWLQRLRKVGVHTTLEYQNDKWVDVNPIRDGIDMPYLQTGMATSYPYVSWGDSWGGLPRNLEKESSVEMWFSPLPPQLHAVLREQALRVIEENTDPDTAVNSFYAAVESDPHRWLTLPDGFVPFPKVWVSAVGMKEDRAARCSCWFTTPMWEVGAYLLMGVSLTVSVLRVLRGETRRRGVMTVDSAFEPMSFLDEVVSLIPDPRPEGKLIDESFEWLEWR
jgi:hypothetical protein